MFSDGLRRSEEHTSELQSHSDLVCRLLLEKKKTTNSSKRIRHSTFVVRSEGKCGDVMDLSRVCLSIFFFNDTATTEIYTLSLHDALPISPRRRGGEDVVMTDEPRIDEERSEEHTSELQSHSDLVCRLLLEKKKKNT